VGDELYFNNCIKLEACPYAYPYNGKWTSVFSPDNVKCIKLHYAVFVKVVIESVHITHLCSKAVNDQVQSYYGGKHSFQRYFKANLDKFISLSEQELTTCTHPESLLNRKYHNHHVTDKIRRWDDVYTLLRKSFGESMPCFEAKFLLQEIGGPWEELSEEVRARILRKRKDNWYAWWNGLSEDERIARMNALHDCRSEWWNGLSEDERIARMNALHDCRSEWWNGLSEDERIARMNALHDCRSEWWNGLSEDERIARMNALHDCRSEWWNGLSEDERIARMNALQDACSERWNGLSEVERTARVKPMQSISATERSEAVRKGHVTKQKNGTGAKSLKDERVFMNHCKRAKKQHKVCQFIL
jgi:hypothetical protein